MHISVIQIPKQVVKQSEVNSLVVNSLKMF